MGGSTEEWGHTYVYEKGVKTTKQIDGYRYLVYYYYVENDGARFIRLGPERHIHFETHPQATLSELEQLLNEAELSEDVQNELVQSINYRKRQASQKL